MATFTFDTVSARPRPNPARKVTRAPAAPVPLPSPPVAVAARRASPSSVLLIGAIVALHAGVVLSLAGAKRTVAVAPLAVPMTISLAPPPKIVPPPKVEPPPPPPPPRIDAAPRASRPKAAAPRPVAAPFVADAPLVAASADTVQVAQTPVASTPDPAPVVAAPAPKEEPVTEPKGYAGYLRNPAPDYPPAAQKRGLEGKVVLKVHVLASGQPDNVTVARSSGHQILDEAALKAVTQWAFAPARRGQTPVDGWVQVPLTFKI